MKGVMPSLLLSRYVVFMAQGIYIAFTLSHSISNKAYVELIGVEITNALGVIEPWIQMNSPHNQPVCACVVLYVDAKLKNICGRRRGAK